MQKIYLVIDLKTFYASVECVERGLNPFNTNLVVADPSRGKGAICLAITPAMKMLGIKNRCRIYEIPPNIKYIIALPCMNKNINLVVNTLIKYDNKDNLSWMMVYKSILKELDLDNMISNSIFLRDVVKKISRDGYDIYDNPFKLVRYK